VLNGFTLQNGAASQDPPFFGTSGGGIVILDASPTVTNNVITRNHAICGIGIEIEGGTALIRGNTITGNTQSFANDLCGGAGIEVQGSSAPSVTAPQIIGSTITFNALSVSGFGGGINPVWKPVIAFVVLIVALLIRPQGLLGRARSL